ncbi:MAG: type II toxin-antitoxin system RelE/ParE family toxin [Boseongicola sp. SB0670_bin_30]|nr:type II toxin-antitoxin system RelE/ParE family toxin [Boseongicola sp. SB0670_bin_30]
MGFDVVRSAGCDSDLDLIHDHLFNAYRDFGDAPDIAFERAVERTRGIEDDMAALGNVPFQGTLEPQIMEGLRYATKGRAVFYFLVDEGHREVQVLGISFGGQDHRKHMLERIKDLAQGRSGGSDDPHA